MADSPVRLLVKIGDPSTAANEVTVTASGELTVISGANAGVNIGDVDINAFDVALTDADDDIIAFAQTTLRTIGLMYASDGVQWERLTSDGAGSLDVNVTSLVPGVGATDLGKAESAAHASGDTGVGVWGVRNDAEAALAADGQYIPFMMSSVGRLLVETQGGSGGTSETDSGVFTPTTDAYTPIGGIFDDVTPSDLTENDGGAVRMSAVREMYMNIRDGAGGERSANVTAGNELNVIATAQPGVDVGDFTLLDSVIDLMLGTDFSNVFGAATLITTTQADGLADTLDGVNGTSFGYNYNGSDWDRVRGDLTDGLLVNLGTNNDVSFTPSTLSGEAKVRTTSSDVAVDGTMNVDEADTGATTSFCVGFDASASVPIKAELQQVSDGTGTAFVTLFAAAGEPIHWRAPHRDYFEFLFSANGGFDGWRVVVTNKDSTDAADLYGTIYTEDV